jgi:mannose-1-phosphate guanylyltransferase
MKAMLLAAGIGQRMLPLTLAQPKPAIPVLGRPLVLQILERLRLSGVDEVVINLHHLPDAMRRLIGDGGGPIPTVHYTEEPSILGTAGGIRNAASLLRGDGPILVCNSDFLADIDVPALVKAHRSAGVPATLVLAPAREGYSEVQWDAEQRVLSLAGEPRAKPESVAGTGLFTGCQVIEEELLDGIPDDRPSDTVRDVYRPLAAEGRLGGHLHRGFWWEFGTPRMYLDGSLRLLDLPPRQLDRVCCEHDTVRNIGGARATIGAGTAIHRTARLLGRVSLGYACQVSSGVEIEDSVVMPEAWVGPDCRLRRAVIGQGAELPAGFSVQDALVCGDPGETMRLPEGARREAGLVLRDFGPAGE